MSRTEWIGKRSAAHIVSLATVVVASCGTPEDVTPLVLPSVHPPAQIEKIERIEVEDFASEDGFTASVWIQGNSALVQGAVACWQDRCATSDDSGFAHVSGLPFGEFAIQVDGGPGVPLLIPLTLNNHWAPHLAARSLTANIYTSWMDADAWPSGTALVDVSLDNASGGLMPGVVLTASAGEVWVVNDFSSAVRDNVSSGTGPIWVAGVPVGTVDLTLTFDDALCSARSMGWAVIAEGNTITMTVPTEADRVTSLYVQCVPNPGA